jgi:transcriptional regulator with PAS, ATPase and Fis domain
VQNAVLSRNLKDSYPAYSVLPMNINDPMRSKDIIGQSDKMHGLFNLVEKVADTDSTILIYGESGTGKELITRAIHNKSSRKNKPLIPINCGAIPENLLESELFGHMQGAFTGATAAKPGKFELAHGGTIFLDEIGDMSPELQVKILRVIEERECERIGGTRPMKVDVRILAATHRNLEEEVQRGNFREDLFYRLHVIPIILPSLRERKEDIPLLAFYFLNRFNQEKKKNVEGFTNEAMAILMGYYWPGNVRELKNIMESLVIFKGAGEIEAKDLPERLKIKKNNTFPPRVEISEEGICLNTAVSEFEKALIIQSLEKTRWVKNKAAKLLHLNRTTLVEKIKRHGLDNVAFGPE